MGYLPRFLRELIYGALLAEIEAITALTLPEYKARLFVALRRALRL